MTTGDYPATAAHVARQVGLPSRTIVTGSELDAMDDKTLRQRIESTDICARVVPEQKLRLVNGSKPTVGSSP